MNFQMDPNLEWRDSDFGIFVIRISSFFSFVLVTLSDAIRHSGFVISWVLFRCEQQ